MYLYEFQRNTFFKWIVVPYFLWALLSLICSIYVAKIALQQVKRASQVHPLINLAQKPQLKTTESNSTLLKDVERGDNNIGEGPGNCSKDNQLIVEEIDEGFDEDKPSTTDATKIISINGSETKGFQNNLPMITMIECPSPCIEPSTNKHLGNPNARLVIICNLPFPGPNVGDCLPDQLEVFDGNILLIFETFLNGRHLNEIPFIVGEGRMMLILQLPFIVSSSASSSSIDFRRFNIVVSFNSLFDSFLMNNFSLVIPSPPRRLNLKPASQEFPSRVRFSFLPYLPFWEWLELPLSEEACITSLVD